MAQYISLPGRATKPIDFGVERSHWDAMSSAEAVEVIHADLRDMILDLRSAKGCTSAMAIAMKAYLGIDWNEEVPSKSQAILQDQIMPHLARVIYAKWVYRTEIFSSYSASLYDPLRRERDSMTVYVSFWHGHDDEITVASACYATKSIQINTRWFTDFKWSGDRLSNLVSRLWWKSDLARLYGSLTPVLLHECLHLASPAVGDVRIHKSELPELISKGIADALSQGDYLTFYSEHSCRLLPQLEEQKFQFARPINNLSRILSFEQLPLQNSDNITRALCATWLASKTQYLSFVPSNTLGSLQVERCRTARRDVVNPRKRTRDEFKR